MKYLVMETHPAYAVLLDEAGRFLKAANLNYQVGDTVQDIIELKTPEYSKKRRYLIRQISALAAAAACFCLVFFGYYQPNYTAYGTIRIRINPEVEMTVSRTERVLGLVGLNADGDDLIHGYDHDGKDRESVTRDLIRRAMEMGYLSEGDSVSISIDSTDSGWTLKEEDDIRTQMEEEYGTQIVIQIGDDAPQDSPDEPEPVPEPVQESIQVVIPTAPQGAESDTDDGDSDYNDTDYSDTDYSDTDYSETDYSPANAAGDDGNSDYESEDAADDSDDDGASDYVPETVDSGASGYSEYEYTDGETDYGGDSGYSSYDDSSDDGSDYDS